MTATIGVVSLQNILDLASQFLGETSVPSAQNSIRMGFANAAKRTIKGIRNWTWELSPVTTMNLVATTSNYVLPTDFKDINAMYQVQVSNDNAVNGVWPYYAPATIEQFQGAVNSSLNDQIFRVTGNYKDGFSMDINPVPANSVTAGILYRYYRFEANFTSVADTTRIPEVEAIAWYVAAQVLYGYREQAQYQLAMDNFQGELTDMSMNDMKEQRNGLQQIKTYRQSLGKTTNFKYYY
jgi:hypothetical protein